MPQNILTTNFLVSLISDPAMTGSSANEAQNIFDMLLSKESNQIGLMADLYYSIKNELSKNKINKDPLGAVIIKLNNYASEILPELKFRDLTCLPAELKNPNLNFLYSCDDLFNSDLILQQKILTDLSTRNLYEKFTARQEKVVEEYFEQKYFRPLYAIHVTNSNGGIRKYNIEDGTLITDFGQAHQGEIRSTSVTRDKKFLFTSDDQGCVKKWWVESSKLAHGKNFFWAEN
jgi:hypothetical protein